MLGKAALMMGSVIFSAATFADTSDIKVSNNQIGIQIISTHVDYTETGNGMLGSRTGTLDTERGWVPGYALSLSTMKDWWLGNDYVEAEYDHSSGNTNYIGAPLGGGPYGSVVSTSGATLTNYSARYGKGFIANDGFMLTPYAELGSHKWDRGVNYGETYTHHYYGVGALGQYSSVNKWVFAANGLIGSTFGSYITVNTGPSLTGFSGGLGNSTLYKVGVSADYALTPHFHGNIGVDYTSFKYGISAVYPVNGGSWEPDSTTHYTTVKFGLGYAF
jgi:hypothetical protein